LDAEDLLANPEETMKLWCEAVQVEFDPAMVSYVLDLSCMSEVG
jgi:hypothetical protein